MRAMTPFWGPEIGRNSGVRALADGPVYGEVQVTAIQGWTPILALILDPDLGPHQARREVCGQRLLRLVARASVPLPRRSVGPGSAGNFPGQ
jgi:hypothetical protein